MLLYCIIIAILTAVVTESNQNYHQIPLLVDQAISRAHTAQKLLLQRSAINYDENMFSPRMWTTSAAELNASQCSREFSDLLNGTQNEETWAMKLIDAWGKPLPSGILTGNTYWVGNYDECLDGLYEIEHKSFLLQPFDSQYCTLAVQLGNGGSMKMNIVVGLCVPKSCSTQELAIIFNDMQKQSNYSDKDFVCLKERQTFSAGPIITVIILSLLFSLLLVGTVVDLMLDNKIDIVSRITTRSLYKNRLFESSSSLENASPQQSRHSITTESLINEPTSTMSSSPSVPFIVEFSVVRILRKIFTIPKTDDSTNFPFLNGMRVLALLWIILSHSLLFEIQVSNNTLDVLSWMQNFAFQLITNGALSVDTFFTMSGFLTAVLFIRQIKKNESKGKGIWNVRFFVMYYVHRYLRLTPTFMLVLMVSLNLTAYFGRGPFFPYTHGFESVGCSKYWWTDLLYVNNLAKPGEMCVSVSWYLANDMQFHWIAPLALIPFALKRKRIAIVVAGLFILTSMISTMTILLANPNMQAGTNAVGGNGEFFNKVYITPWCRITAYAVGLLTGFIVLETGRTYRLNVFVKAGFSILALITFVICMLVPYYDSITPQGLSKPVTIAFQTVNRTLWSMSIGWLIFLCSTDNAKLINKILSWPVFIPLARLNYAAYLIHSMVIFTMVFNLMQPIHFQAHVLLQQFVSNTVLSYAAAIVVVLLFEAPFFAIEKKLFKH